MTVLHLADLHLGIEAYGRRDPGTGLSTRLLDALRCLDEAVTYAITEAVDLVVIAGDVYDRPDPDPACQREFGARIARLSREGIPVVIVLGDHDLPALRERANGLAPLTSLEVEGVTVCRVPEIFTMETGAGAIEIAALPAAATADLVSTGERASLSSQQAVGLQRQRLAERIANLDGAREGALPSILLAHLEVEGASAGSEADLADLMVHRAPSLGGETLAETGFDYIALGHLHSYQDLSPGAKGPSIVYAGSPDRLDFGDERVAKGFVVAQLGRRRRARHELLRTPARRFVTVRARAGADDPTQAALAAIQRRRVGDAIVRLIVSAAEGAALDRSAIRAALADAHFIGPIIAEAARSRAQTRAAERRLGMTDPVEALKAHLQARGVPPAQTRALCDAAARLVGETEPDQGHTAAGPQGAT